MQNQSREEGAGTREHFSHTWTCNHYTVLQLYSFILLPSRPRDSSLPLHSSPPAVRKVQGNTDFHTHSGGQECYIIPLILLTGNCLNLNKVTAHDLIMSDPNWCNLNNVSIDQLKLSLLSDPCQRKTWARFSPELSPSNVFVLPNFLLAYLKLNWCMLPLMIAKIC